LVVVVFVVEIFMFGLVLFDILLELFVIVGVTELLEIVVFVLLILFNAGLIQVLPCSK
jgi:hypothetical protein